MNIQIRGGNSMNGSNEPLYIIDGFPIEINQDEVAADASAGMPSSTRISSRG